MPKVSVLIPTYNYARYLEEAIESVLNQTFTDFELIIIDDQSKDNTDEVVQKYLRDPRVSYQKNPVNLGLVGNFNRALELANGEYIKFLLADDKLEKTILSKFVAVLDTYPGVSLVTCISGTFGDVVQTREIPLNGLQPGKSVIMESLNHGKGNWIGEPSVVMFRKSSLPQGRFNPEYICLVDLDMWLRLLTTGDCYIVPETLAYFRKHGWQASDKSQIRNWFDEYYFYRDVKKKNIYNVDLAQLDIDTVIRRKAKKCVKRVSGLLPRFYKKGNLALIVEGLRIGRAEKIF
ncbi:MAG: glycosyltransferase [Sphingobacteriales bacterium]|nr:MAG: glycosyltransferase [Sphingobacteriales bacterium]